MRDLVIQDWIGLFVRRGMPGRFDVAAGAGRVGWQGLEIVAGKTTVLNPARIEIVGSGTYKVTTSDGRDAGTVSQLLRLPLPPGKARSAPRNVMSGRGGVSIKEGNWE